MPKPRLLLASLAAVLGGCVSYQRKDIDPVATAAQWDRRSLADAGLQKFLAAHGWVAGTEWDLPRLTLAAFYFNPSLDVARARLAEAEAGVRTAEARPNPTFTFTPGRSDQTPGGITPWILGYALNIPIELAGKRAHRTTEAQRAVERARLELASVAWGVHRAVRGALIEWDGAVAEVELGRRQLPLVARAAQLATARVEAGDTSPLEAAQARTALARAELAARESERAETTARSRVAEALGVPLGAINEIRLSGVGLVDAPPPSATTEARAWAPLNRADLLGALAAYAASQAVLQSEIARQYPNLTLGPGYQLDQGKEKWSVGIGVTLPVFNRNEGPIAAAEASRAAAAANFLTVQNRVLAEVDRAVADYASVQVDLERVRGLRTTLEQQTRLMRARHEAGEISRLELVRAEMELMDQSRTELAARRRAAHALGAFEDAVQRPLAWPELAWRGPVRVTEAK